MGEKSTLEKLKELGSMDIKDIGKLFKKESLNKEEFNVEVKNIIKNPIKERSKLVLAIDLGSNSIKLVEGRLDKGLININKLVKIKLREGIIGDGNIISKMELEVILRNAIVDNDIKAKDVIITTNSSSIINRDILIPVVKDEEIDTVVKYEIQQYLPINLDDYVIQFLVLDKVKDGEEDKLKVNVTAFPQRISLSYYNLINSLDLNPYALDVNYNSITKFSNYMEDIKLNLEKSTAAFVDMGASTINISILKDNKLDFTRLIKIGGDNIDYAINQNSNISIKAAEEINKEYLNNTFVREILDELVLELERIFQFYKNKSQSNIDKVYIYGGISHIEDLDKYLQERLSIKVNKLIEFKNIKTKQSTENISIYLNAIGSIIRL